MSFSLVLWSDKPGTWSIRSLKPGDDMASNRDTVRQVQSLPALVSTLIELKKNQPGPAPSTEVVVPGAASQQPVPEGAGPREDSAFRDSQFTSLTFNTHGTGGILFLGADEVTPNMIRSEVGGKGFESLFRPNATVTFLGCNIAEGPDGELFLATAGEVFLKGGGGDVKGNTGMGLAMPLVGSTVGFQLGDWITARVGSGGTVKLLNPKHLDMGLIIKRIERAKARIALVERERKAPVQEVQMMNIMLRDADKWAAKGAATLINMVNSCDALDMLERKLDDHDVMTFP